MAEPRAGSGATSSAVRRYRIARLRLDGRPAAGESRAEQLKRVHE